METYYIDETEDQPATCPKCGARTEFTETEWDAEGRTTKQVHTCLDCLYEFTLVIECRTVI